MKVDLPDARRAGDADADGAAGVRAAAPRGARSAAVAVVGPGRLDERDGPGERPPVAGADARRRARRRSGARHARSAPLGASSRTSRAASGMLVPGPKIAATPASRRMS